MYTQITQPFMLYGRHRSRAPIFTRNRVLGIFGGVFTGSHLHWSYVLFTNFSLLVEFWTIPKLHLAGVCRNQILWTNRNRLHRPVLYRAYMQTPNNLAFSAVLSFTCARRVLLTLISVSSYLRGEMSTFAKLMRNT